jgi:hypothetical protein
MSGDIDLDFRPETYFRPQKLARYLLPKVKGAVLRKNLQALFGAGRHAEVRSLLTNEGISLASAASRPPTTLGASTHDRPMAPFITGWSTSTGATRCKQKRKHAPTGPWRSVSSRTFSSQHGRTALVGREDRQEQRHRPR